MHFVSTLFALLCAGVSRTSAGLRCSRPPSFVGLVTTHAAPTLHTHSTDSPPVVTTGSTPAHRFAWVAAYCVSPFGAAERAWKPFNPILGETFELEIGNGVHYLAEQVSKRAQHGVAVW